MNTFAASPHISLSPEILFHIGPFAVTNAQMLTVLGTAILILILVSTMRAIKRGSRNRFMHAVMWLFESLYDTTVEVIGDRRVARKVLPLAVTLMFFFLINNWLGIFPFVGSVLYNDTPMFRSAAADLNTTFALAIISMTTAQIWAIKRHGFFGNIRRYTHSPFEGALEVIAELSRTLALSLRIFGNVFGGEVLLIVIALLTSWAAPLALPLFYGLELFVGAIQAYVFFMLTVAFISLGLPSGEGHGEPATATEKMSNSK